MQWEISTHPYPVVCPVGIVHSAHWFQLLEVIEIASYIAKYSSSTLIADKTAGEKYPGALEDVY